MAAASTAALERKRTRDRERHARNREAGIKDERGNRHPNNLSKPFIGIDGEGGEVVQNSHGEWVDGPPAGGNHHYLLLRAGDDVLMNPDRAPLTSLQCLDFLADLPIDRLYVGFFFDYDVTMILRDMPRELMALIFDRSARTVTMKSGQTLLKPVEWNGFLIEYLPRKEFKVKRKGSKRRYTVVSDVGSFFQCAFLAALKKWNVGTDEQWQHIAEGKSGRVNFGALTDDTIAYNGIEIALLEELMTKFRQAAIDAGIIPNKWQGPGYMAEAMFKIHRMIEAETVQDRLPARLLEAANASYYGGRFEITAVGAIPGPVYQHDINSAYPYAETLLPCLEHGTWTRGTTIDDRIMASGLFLAHGSYEPLQSVPLYGLPYRNKLGNISWRGSGSGWYWSHEIRAAVYQRFTIDDVWIYEKHCDCQPFEFIRRVYDMRAMLGKSSKGETFKLAMNSTYGKMCQSIGSPKYANPIYASLITSFTRAQLYTKCVRFGVDKVVMLATDGIFTTSQVDKGHSPKETRHRLDGSTYEYKPLGDWEVTTYDDGIFIVQPGLYFLPGDEKPKTRGIPMSKAREHRDDFKIRFRELQDHLRSHRLVIPWVKPVKGARTAFDEFAVPITLRCFLGAKLGTHIGSDQIGEWVEAIRSITFDWSTKRGRWEDRDTYLSLHPIMIGDESVPYSKDIGRMINEQRAGNPLAYLDPDSPELDTDKEW